MKVLRVTREYFEAEEFGQKMKIYFVEPADEGDVLPTVEELQETIDDHYKTHLAH